MEAPSAAAASKSSQELRPLDGRRHHYARAALIGLLAGLVAVAFQFALTAAEGLRIRLLDALADHPAWGWAVLPALGLFVGSGVGLLVKFFSPEAAGSGIPHVKGVLLGVRKLAWLPLMLVKFFGGVLGVGVGLSLGREGPTVQMGAAVGQAVAERQKVRPRTAPQLISCGAGAGLAAAFNAPLAGFLFVIEELHREFSALTFGGALIAAVVAAAVTQTVFGQGHSFSVRGFPQLPLAALPLAALLGVLCGLLGVFFNRSLLAAQRWGHSLSWPPRWLWPGIVACVLGLLAWFLPDAVGGGHAVADKILGERWQPSFLFLMLLLTAKLAATAFSYMSGAPGGIFAPMLLLGALLGLAFGQIAGAVFPQLQENRAAFAVLAMAAMFTGSVRAPLTGIVLILEMTGDYQQLFAVCVACLFAYLAAEALGDFPIYEALLEADLRRHGLGASHATPITVLMGVQRDSAVAGKTIRAAAFPPLCVVVHVERGGRELLPVAELEIAPGDHITVLVPGDQPALALKVADMCRTQMA